MIYFTSDLHLLRTDEKIYKERGYKNCLSMAEDYVAKINSAVKTDDVLYILGDILGGNLKEANEYFKQIKCENIHIICGNYETPEALELLKNDIRVKELKDAIHIKMNGYKFFLSHYPCRTGDFSLKGDPIKRKIWSLCGHTHTHDKFKELKLGIPAYHVEVDAHDGYPVSISQIIKDIEYFTGNNLPPTINWEDEVEMAKIANYFDVSISAVSDRGGNF